MKPTSYVVTKFGCDPYTAQKWAKANGVELIGNMYFWTDEEIIQFSERPRPGRKQKKDKNR